MMRSLEQFARACGGTLHGADRSYAGVWTDTRSLHAGDLFVALRGPRFNGNEFVGVAHAAGAAGAVVDVLQPAPLTQILVPDTQAALTSAARHWRDQFSMPVLGVAGSNGKTSTKEMLAAILTQAGTCLATRGNLNNHIGVPLTLLRLRSEHRFAVIEMGADRVGEVAALAALARPIIGLITNAGAEHLQGFGSLEAVARAEGEMVAGLARAGTAVINADDPNAALWRSLTRARVIDFGLDAAAQFRATAIRAEVGPQGFMTHFTLESPLGSATVALGLAGTHNVLNALAASAAAAAAGATLAHIVAGLATVRAVPGRLQFKYAASGARLLDDSYNANPNSVRVGIEVLATLAGRKWLVLGDMAELGSFAESAHADIGVFARAHGIERLFATGALTVTTVESFGAGGQWFPDAQVLSRTLLESATADVSILIKGSRSNRLERVVAALLAAPTEQKGE